MPVYYTREQKKQLADSRGIIVDPEDAWLLEEYTWHVNSGYARAPMGRDEYGRTRTMFLHHAIMGEPIWEGDEIDHINRNTIDNSRQNLRYATQSENRINTSRSPGPTGMRNIYLKEDSKYYVRIRRNRIEHFVGSFTTLEEAIIARDKHLQVVSIDIT